VAIEPADGEVLATGAVLESVDELKKCWRPNCRPTPPSTT
jgi:hypothetical protein